MASSNFNINEYNNVAKRVADAHDLGLVREIRTEAPTMLTATVGYIRAHVTFIDGTYTTGTASFRLDGIFQPKKNPADKYERLVVEYSNGATTSGSTAQVTNPIEDAETSAVGRALAFQGMDTKARPGAKTSAPRRLSIASAEEVVIAKARAEIPTTAQVERAHAAVKDLMAQAIARGITVEHDAAADIDTATYEELVGLGKQLRQLLA